MFIVFEGLDGSGKSTQAGFLQEYLAFMTKKTVHSFRLPGSTESGEKIRDLIFDKERVTPLNPMTELLLFAAGHAQLVNEKIFPAIKRDEIVILDRYIWSTLAYQVYLHGVNEAAALNILNTAISYLMPDLVIFMDIAPEISFERRGGAAAVNIFDDFEISFREQIKQGYYRCLRKTDSSRYFVVNGDQSLDSIRIQICGHVYKKFFAAPPILEMKSP